jgi:hypothetical protein
MIKMKDMPEIKMCAMMRYQKIKLKSPRDDKDERHA